MENYFKSIKILVLNLMVLVRPLIVTYLNLEIKVFLRSCRLKFHDVEWTNPFPIPPNLNI